MFRLTLTALTSQRKRGIEPGALAVKVGGKHLYPKVLIDRYLDHLASTIQTSLGLDERVGAELFRLPPTNTRMLTLDEAAERLGIDAATLAIQWESNTYPGWLGWRPTPDAGIVFTPRDLDIWTEANANHDRQDAPSAHAD